MFDIKEILKFTVSGGSAVIVDAVIYAILKSNIGLSLAKAISYIAGAIIGFIINKFWTFQRKQFRMSEIYKYAALYTCSACANTLVNRLTWLGFGSAVFAFLCATGTSTVINFIGQKFFVFQRKGEK